MVHCLPKQTFDLIWLKVPRNFCTFPYLFQYDLNNDKIINIFGLKMTKIRIAEKD